MSRPGGAVRGLDRFLMLRFPTLWIMRAHKFALWGGLIFGAEVLFALLVPVSPASTLLPSRIFWWGMVPGGLLLGWWIKNLAGAGDVFRASHGRLVGAQLMLSSITVMAAIPVTSYVAAQTAMERVGGTVSAETIRGDQWILEEVNVVVRQVKVLMARGPDHPDSLWMDVRRNPFFDRLTADPAAYVQTVERYAGAIPPERVAEILRAADPDHLDSWEGVAQLLDAFEDHGSSGSTLWVSELTAQEAVRVHARIKNATLAAYPYSDSELWMTFGAGILALLLALGFLQEMERPAVAVTIPVLLGIASYWFVWLQDSQESRLPIYAVPALGAVSLALATIVPAAGRSRLLKGLFYATAQATVCLIPLSLSSTVLDQLRWSQNLFSPEIWALESLFYQSVAAGLILLVVSDGWFRRQFAYLRSTPR